MEAYAAEHDVPIVGPVVATLLEILARSIGASRVFEMGSAIGYSTAFFARAVGEGAGLPRPAGALRPGRVPRRRRGEVARRDDGLLRRDLHRRRQGRLSGGP